MEERRIRPLPKEVVGQIAAGEVVERPAAAIKELCENSMDAGATAITVDIKDGGLTSFRVTDNGRGIPPEDLRMAFERHATSKIISSDDLAGVKTLGFRGEALASIAAVARVTCKTRHRGEPSGMELINEGGEILSIRDAACPEGASFTVREIFYNAPVRRKFMKKPAAEAALTGDILARMILSRPDISFRFVSDGKNVYFSPGDGKIESAALCVFGLDTVRAMKRVEGNQGGVSIRGLVGVGEQSRGNRAMQFFFVNHRAMRGALLTQALEEGCRQRVMIGRYPVCALHLDMPYETCDVNVHPNKWEIRFQDEARVRDAVETVIREALTPKEPVADAPKLFVAPEKPISAPVEVSRTIPIPPPPPPKPAATLRETSFAPPRPPAVKAPEPPAQTESEQVKEIFEKPVAKVIGVAFNTYILVEYGDQLLLCDQHALHERFLFDKMSAAKAEGTLSQTMLAPQILTLSLRQYAAYEKDAEALSDAGYELSPFGDTSLRLLAAPVGIPDPGRCLLETLDDLSVGGTYTRDACVARVMQSACKHAVKGGEHLPLDAARELIERLLRENPTPTCPHGRPLTVSVTRTELEKRFRRIQE